MFIQILWLTAIIAVGFIMTIDVLFKILKELKKMNKEKE